MIKQIVLVFTFILAITFCATSQAYAKSEDTVGFACNRAGSQSLAVQKVSSLLEKDKFMTIARLLKSKNSAEKILAVVVCEKLVELDKFILTKRQRENIKQIYKSNVLVPVCSGCTYQEELPLRELLDAESKMGRAADYWIKNELTSM